MKYGMKDKAFDGLMIVITAFVSILCLLPLIYMAAVSMSSNYAISAKLIYLWPVEFTMDAYRQIFNEKSMLNSMAFTIWLTIVYTILSMVMTVLCAYPLTKKGLVGRNFFLVLIVVTMYFSGGMIPDYILIRSLNLVDNPLSLILPGCLSAFNMIILKSFFSNLPESLEESAFLDGASYFSILLKIVLPLSTPVLATLSLFYAVGRWNGFQDSLIYITNMDYYPIQLKLYQMIYNNQAAQLEQIEGSGAAQTIAPEGLKAAAVMFATVPILLVYPWLQKYFISGIMIGAIKG